MGAERKSLIISDEEKRATAYHEAGHALVAFMLPDADPLHKVTIIPRGRALGVTQQLPVDDRHTYSREYLRGDDRRADGRPRRRGAAAGPADHRRRQRLRAGHRAGAQDGLRVGHVGEAGAADLRQAGRADLPRPRDRAAPRLQRGDRRRDRRRGQAHRARGLRPGRTHPRGQRRRADPRSPRRCSSARCSTPRRSRPWSRASRLPALKTPTGEATQDRKASSGAEDAAGDASRRPAKGPGVLPEPGNQPA